MAAPKGQTPWNKGTSKGWINRRGYLCIQVDGREQKVHRLVMEKKLGRKLEPDELVHHKDENKLNNDPDNLELKDWGEHTTDHHKGAKRTEYTKRSIEIIANYRQELIRVRSLNTDMLEALEYIKMAAEPYENDYCDPALDGECQITVSLKSLRDIQAIIQKIKG